jgi:hypothetical protein
MQRLAYGEVQADLTRSYGVSCRVTALSRQARPAPSEVARGEVVVLIGAAGQGIAKVHKATPHLGCDNLT